MPPRMIRSHASEGQGADSCLQPVRGVGRDRSALRRPGGLRLSEARRSLGDPLDADRSLGLDASPSFLVTAGARLGASAQAAKRRKHHGRA